jgi:hypothetical protein
VLEVSAESDTRGLLAEDSTAPRPAAAGGGGVDRNNGGHSRHLEDDGAEGSAAAAASRQRPEDSSGQQDDEDEYIIVVQNVHKTYLLGVEGVAALRCALTNPILASRPPPRRTCLRETYSMSLSLSFPTFPPCAFLPHSRKRRCPTSPLQLPFT